MLKNFFRIGTSVIGILFVVGSTWTTLSVSAAGWGDDSDSTTVPSYSYDQGDSNTTSNAYYDVSTTPPVTAAAPSYDYNYSTPTTPVPTDSSPVTPAYNSDSWGANGWLNTTGNVTVSSDGRDLPDTRPTIAPRSTPSIGNNTVPLKLSQAVDAATKEKVLAASEPGKPVLVNSATLKATKNTYPRFAFGSYVTAFGEFPTAATNSFSPTSSGVDGGITVTVARSDTNFSDFSPTEVAAKVTFTSPGQINFILPESLPDPNGTAAINPSSAQIRIYSDGNLIVNQFAYLFDHSVDIFRACGCGDGDNQNGQPNALIAFQQTTHQDGTTSTRPLYEYTGQDYRSLPVKVNMGDKNRIIYYVNGQPPLETRKDGMRTGYNFTVYGDNQEDTYNYTEDILISPTETPGVYTVSVPLDRLMKENASWNSDYEVRGSLFSWSGFIPAPTPYFGGDYDWGMLHFNITQDPQSCGQYTYCELSQSCIPPYTVCRCPEGTQLDPNATSAPWCK